MSGLNSIPQCRLCCAYGLHKIDIFDDDADNLREKILRCVGIPVQRSDKTTKICQNCFDKTNQSDRFYQICAAANIQMEGISPNVDNADATIERTFWQDDSIQTEDPFGEIEMPTRETESNERNTFGPNAHSSMRNANDRPCSPVSDRNADKIVLMYFTISTENRSSLNANQNENEMPGNQFANNSAVTSKDEIIPKVELHDQATGNENATTFTVKCRHGNCNDLFESNGAVMLHMRSYHAKVKKTYNCHLCKKTLSSRVGIKRHMNAIHMGECFRCSYRTCLKVFKREDVLTEHVKNVHIQELKCPKCSRKFSRNVNMKRHMARRHFKNRGKTKAKRFKKSASKSNLN